MSFTGQGFAATQQLGVDLREFLDLFLELAVVFDPGLSGLLLGRCFKEEFIHLTDGKALGQIVEGAVLMALLMTVAVGFAAAGKSLDEGGAQAVGQDMELRKQKAFALAQGQRGLPGKSVYLCHMYGEDTKTGDDVNKNENGAKMRKCSTAGKH